MAWQVMDQWRLGQHDNTDGNGLIDMETPAGNLAICQMNGSPPNQNTGVFFSTVASNECTGTNYPGPRGQTLGNPTVTLDGSGNLKIDADDPATISQSASGIDEGNASARADYALLIHNTGVDATSRMIAYHVYSTPRGNVGQDFQVQLDATDGLMVQAR